MQRFTRREFGGLAVAIAAQPVKLFAKTGTDIDTVLRSGSQQRKIPAVAAIAGTANAITYSGAFGTRDSASGVAVTLDSIFSIASMTKAITSAAAMQLVEQGKMTLDEPASKHLPELGMLQVLEGFDAAGKPMLRPAVKPVTLRQLLTHTSGFAYDTWHDGMFKLTSSGADITHVLAFEPGNKWQYGPSTRWAGRLVEAVSGQDLEKYLQQNVLGPLGMKDTTFIFPKEKFERLVGNYQRQPDGSLTPMPRTLPPPPATYRGDGGLFSTAPDYLKFTQTILRRGAGPGGERILKEKTVALMSANGTGHIPAGRLKTARPAQSSDVDFHPGHDDRYTLGFLMNPEAIPGERSAGSLAWAGINNTYYWIDPRRGISGVIMMQFLPFADKEAVGLLDDFQRAVYASRT
jgi:CubicO group peptidase (beta-lactamase class C family)